MKSRGNQNYEVAEHSEPAAKADNMYDEIQHMKADLLQQAIEHHQAGALQQAADIYQRMLATDPKHADANHLLGLIAHQCGNQEAALQLILHAIESNPSHHIYFCNLGIVRMALEQWDDAITAFQTAIRLNLGDLKAHINLGIALERTGRNNEALAAYQKALSIAPNDTEILNKLGNAYAQLKRMEEATTSFQKALQLNPASVATLNSLGIMHRDIGQLDQSISYYHRALKIAPERFEILCNLAIALQDTGRLQEAESACQKALSYNTSYTAAYKQLTDALHFQQRSSDWDAVLDSALTKADLSTDSRNQMLISKAIIAWMDGNVDACGQILSMAAPLLSQTITDKVTYSAMGYYKFLKALVAFRNEHPSLYTVSGKSHIHMIGDSHSLSYTGTVLELDANTYQVVSHLIMGCKAWHLSQHGPNRYKAAFDCVLQKLSHGDTAIISMGEIDCRSNEGIFPAHKKHDTDLANAIESLVGNFVHFILHESRKKQLNIIFYGVPAPSCSLEHFCESDRLAYLTTVELFNTSLAKAAASSQCRFIDVYGHTVATGGVSNGIHHIDPFHLAPDFLAHACKHLDATGLNHISGRTHGVRVQEP